MQKLLAYFAVSNHVLVIVSLMLMAMVRLAVQGRIAEELCTSQAHRSKKYLKMSIQIVRETHETPEYVANLLTRVGGLNRFGEPNFRFVWGWNRLTLIGGEWEKTSDGPAAQNCFRMVPKYPQVNRWIMEKWVPPEVYGSPWTWKGSESERELGPYPYRGEYEHSFTLEGPKGEFIQLTLMVAEYIASAIRASMKYKPKKHTLYAREAKKDQEYLTWAEAIMDDNHTWAYTPHSYPYEKLKEKPV